MPKIDSWITKLPRLKNSKVARFSYRAEAYANDEIEGVSSYDYAQDMNVPLATHTDFDASMLSIGARTNFSSVPKNGLNHFFGRVSYNLNKVIDFLSDFLDDFISFTEIVSFSSSATLANYADGSTKRLLNTAGSAITLTLPAGETYLGNNKILLAPSIMLTITKRGTVWINSSGNASTATLADRAKDSYPIPTDAVLQYSFDEIKQLPDNPAGTTYKKDNDWTTVDGWTRGHVSITVSTENQLLKVVYDGTRPDTGMSIFKDNITPNGKFIVGSIESTVPIINVRYYNGTSQVNLNLNKKTEYEAIFYGYMSSTIPTLLLYVNHNQNTAKTCWIESMYIGDGTYVDPVIDNSYSEAHATNYGVIPVDGVCGKAGYFNNSYMIAPRPAFGDDITIYFWAKLDALGTAQAIIQSRTVADQGLAIDLSGSSVYRLYWRRDSSLFTGYTPPVATWHHVCIKMNATTKVLKINGETKVTLTGVYETTQNLASTIWSGMAGAGGTPSALPLTGALDGLKIVPRFTTDDEDTGEYKARANLPKFYTYERYLIENL